MLLIKKYYKKERHCKVFSKFGQKQSVILEVYRDPKDLSKVEQIHF